MKLEGEKAIELWLAGKEKWNKWVEENPIADVSFAGVVFNKAIVSNRVNYISFADYNFPQGRVDFSEARFQWGNVTFYKANFGKGEVFFYKANFGNGDVDFREASFEEGEVHFTRAKFGEGNVYFGRASFGKGMVIFSGASFGEGIVDFSGASFGEGNVNFENIIFKGHADFSDLLGCDGVKMFSFKNVSFEKTFTLSGKFGCVVDMVGTKTSHHVDLSGLKCDLQRNKRHWVFFKKADDEKDASRLRRLKELAENNKHHEAGLRFHADEMRAKRWYVTGKFASVLDILFDFFSDYGQSIWRPVAGLAVLTIASPFVAYFLAKIWEVMGLPIDKDLIKTVIRDSLPFLPASRSIETSITSILHQLVALIFIFLIGLGLRNRFRI